MFNEIEEDLQSFGYTIFMNANIEVREEITKSILPEKENLIAVMHPGFHGYPRTAFTYETNPLSTACILPEEGTCYFFGALNGGKTKNFLKMSKILAKNIDTDMKE